MNLRTLTLGAFESNGYVLERDGVRLVVDPGAEPDRLARAAGGAAAAILLTHGHADHLSGLPGLLGEWPGTCAHLHPADRSWALGPSNAIPPFYEPARLDPARVLALPAGPWTCGPFSLEVLHTPGHTPGSVCFYDPAEGVVFTGDTLFQGSVGRTDLPGSDPRAMTRSLRALARLPDATRVLCGHGPETTIGIERARNFFLQAASRGLDPATS